MTHRAIPRETSRTCRIATVATALVVCLVGLPIATPCATVPKPKVVIDRAIVTYNGGPKCPIELNDYYGGGMDNTSYYIDGRYTHGDKGGRLLNQPIFIELLCYSSGYVDKYTSPVRFDLNKMKWVASLAGWNKEDIRNLKISLFKGINSDGFSMSQASTSGGFHFVDFYFCLRHPPVALCGQFTDHADHADLSKNKKYLNKKLPLALRIIQSIKFVDTPAAASTASSVPAPAGSQAHE